jgi:hypothetical protein
LTALGYFIRNDHETVRNLIDLILFKISFLRQSYSRNSFTDDELDLNENSPIITKLTSSRKKSYKKWTKEEV